MHVGPTRSGPGLAAYISENMLAPQNNQAVHLENDFPDQRMELRLNLLHYLNN